MHHKAELASFLKRTLWHDVKSIHRQLARTWRCLFTEAGPPEALSTSVEAELHKGLWAEAVWSYIGNSTKLENLPTTVHSFLCKAQASVGLFDLPHFQKLSKEALLSTKKGDTALAEEAARLATSSVILAKIRGSFASYASRLAPCDMETLFHQAETYRDLTLLLLSPHNQVRQATEALFSKRAGLSSKRDAILYVALLSPETFVKNLSAAMKTLLELRPDHCFGSWAGVSWIAEQILPDLAALCASGRDQGPDVPEDGPLSGAVMKLYLRLWTWLRRCLKGALKFRSDARFDAVICSSLRLWDTLWSAYVSPQAAGMRDRAPFKMIIDHPEAPRHPFCCLSP